MKSFVRASLLIESAIFALYGLAFIFFPQQVHNLLSTGAYNPATAYLVTAMLLGLSLIFLIEAQNPIRERVYTMAVALGILGMAIALGILNGGGIKVNAGTLFALVITLGMAVYIFILQGEETNAGTMTESSAPAPKTVKKKSRSPAKKAKPAKKKTSKKKAKKTAKKKAKKKARGRR